MKLQITFKNPDGVADSIADAIHFESMENTDFLMLSEQEQEEIKENKRKELLEQISPWVEYGEYVTIEINTDDNTAKVLKVNE